MRKSSSHQPKRLGFLRQFLGCLGVSIRNISCSIMSSGAFRRAFFVGDSLPLSVARKLVELYGGRLHISLIPRGLRHEPNEDYRRYNPNQNLAFLRETISRLGMTRAEFAEEIGLTRDAVSYWFGRDDIQISRLYYIAAKLDADLIFSITSADMPEARRPRVITNILLRDAVSITPVMAKLNED